VDPAWRRLSDDKQIEHKKELYDTIYKFNRRMLLRPYSLMGTRADCELLLWQIAESIEPFQELSAAMARTRMGAYLTLSVSLLSQTKRSIYEIRDHPEERDRLVIDPTESKYLFVYPFLKTRPWYKLPHEQRQAMMDEHIRVGRKYPSVKLNTTYSFGLDDQEFVVAFETDNPSDFLDLVQDLRETDASLYTLRDTPLYTCMNMGLDEALDALGGPAISVNAGGRKAETEWAPVGPVSELADGGSKLVYVGGQQIAVFKVKGELYAISNRCSHARGPLTEGAVDAGECSVTCPWHYAKFDLRSGQVVDGVASAPVGAYPVEVREGILYVSSAAKAVGAEAAKI
jgi:chlorite dismutase